MNLAELLEKLSRAIRLGESLGLDTYLDSARQTLEDARSRHGFPGETYVLALIGGTGVGKSSLLNSIAGDEVTEASVIRPTTHKPRAWVEDSRIDEVRPLLDWLGVDQVVTRREMRLGGLTVLDMPDFDSIVSEHRMTVDRLLPRLDSLLWVVDPEKYDDERLYEYLREVGPRADAFHIVLNKIDRLSDEEQAELSRDLMRRLIEAGIDGAAVHLVSAAEGEGVGDLIGMLESRAEAKRVIYGKIRADVMAAIDEIAGHVWLDSASELTSESLSERRAEAVSAAMDVVDPGGISRQVAAAYLEKASVAAGSLLGRLGALARLVFGVRRRKADPGRYIRDWRSRGDVSRAVNVLRQTYLDTTSDMSVAGRAAVLTRLDPDAAAEGITTALDSALVASAREFEVRSPVLWYLLFILQFFATGGVVVAVLWYVTLWLAPAELPVGTIDVPEIGPVPTPLALLVVSAVASLIIGGLVRAHASWLGRRAAKQVVAGVEERVAQAVDQHCFDSIDHLRSTRAELAALSEQLRDA